MTIVELVKGRGAIVALGLNYLQWDDDLRRFVVMQRVNLQDCPYHTTVHEEAAVESLLDIFLQEEEMDGQRTDLPQGG